MAFELVYTSVPRGIKPGSSGFCTVAYTNGLAANVALQLEGMSAYKPYFPHYDENAKLNPVSFSHYLFSSSGKDFHILSRACFYGQDYTKRSNKLAHHVVIEKYDIAQLTCGPAAISLQNDFFRCEWSGEPQLFQQQKQISKSADTFKKAETWAAYTGDAGWAGTLAQHFLDAPTKPVFVIFDPLKHKNTLSLVQEAIQLLPSEKRWQVSYNTYFTMLPAGITCCWRFCVPDADVLKEARRTPGTLVIDLTRPLPQADAGKLQDAARTGVVPFEQKKAESATQTHSAENEPPSSLGKQQRRATQQKRQDIRQGNQLPMKTKQATKSPVLPIVIVSALVLIGGIGWGVYFYTQQKAEEKRILAEREAREKIAKEKKNAEIAKIREETRKAEEEKKKLEEAQKAEAERLAQEDAEAERLAKEAETKKKRDAEERAKKEAEEQKRVTAEKEKKAKLAQQELAQKKLAQQENDFIKQKQSSFWFDADLESLRKPGGQISGKWLCDGETVKRITVSNKIKTKNCEEKEGVFIYADETTEKRYAQYRVECKGHEQVITNELSGVDAWRITSIELSNGIQMYAKYSPDKCELPCPTVLTEDDKITIKFSTTGLTQLAISYQETAFDSSLLSKDPDVFSRLTFFIKIGNEQVDFQQISKENTSWKLSGVLKQGKWFSDFAGLKKELGEKQKEKEAADSVFKQLEKLGKNFKIRNEDYKDTLEKYDIKENDKGEYDFAGRLNALRAELKKLDQNEKKSDSPAIKKLKEEKECVEQLKGYADWKKGQKQQKESATPPKTKVGQALLIPLKYLKVLDEDTYKKTKELNPKSNDNAGLHEITADAKERCNALGTEIEGIKSKMGNIRNNFQEELKKMQAVDLYYQYKSNPPKRWKKVKLEVK